MMKSHKPQVQGPLRTGPETRAKLHSSCSRNRQKARVFSELHLFYGMVRTEERMFFSLPNQQWKQTCNLRIFEPSGTWKKNKLFLTFSWLQLNSKIILQASATCQLISSWPSLRFESLANEWCVKLMCHFQTRTSVSVRITQVLCPSALGKKNMRFCQPTSCREESWSRSPSWPIYT